MSLIYWLSGSCTGSRWCFTIIREGGHQYRYTRTATAMKVRENRYILIQKDNVDYDKFLKMFSQCQNKLQK